MCSARPWRRNGLVGDTGVHRRRSHGDRQASVDAAFAQALMPPFCIGYQARGTGDYDSYVAADLAESVIDQDIDVAISRQLMVDPSHETRTWVAAYSALRACGEYSVDYEFFRPIKEHIAGFAVITATLRGHS